MWAIGCRTTRIMTMIVLHDVSVVLFSFDIYTSVEEMTTELVIANVYKICIIIHLPHHDAILGYTVIYNICLNRYDRNDTTTTNHWFAKRTAGKACKQINKYDVV